MKYFLSIFLFYRFSALFAQIPEAELSGFNNVLNTANEDEKYVLLFTYADWCNTCSTMLDQMIADSALSKTLERESVLLKTNVEEGIGLLAAMKYNISQLPAIMVFSSKGQLLYSLEGYAAPDELRWAVENNFGHLEQMPPRKMSFPELDSLPQFYRNSFGPSGLRTLPDKDLVRQYIQNNMDSTNEGVWNVVNRLADDNIALEYISKNREELDAKYGSAIKEKLISPAYNILKQAMKLKSEALLTEALAKADEILGAEAAPFKLRFKMYFYQVTGKIQQYMVVADSAVKMDLLSPFEKLELAATACNTAINYTAAKAWIEDFPYETTYDYLTVKACLIALEGKKSEALSTAKKAIEEGRAKGLETDEFEKLINEIVD